jgi:phage protein D
MKMGIRRVTKAEIAAKKAAAKKATANQSFKAAKRRGRGDYTPEELAQIKITKARVAAKNRKKLLQGKRIKKANTKVVKKSKRYA